MSENKQQQQHQVTEQKVIELINEVEEYINIIGQSKDALASAEQELDETLQTYYDQQNNK